MMTSDLSVEARWRNYQQLIWTQQQIHLQIQQQQQLQQQQLQQQQQQHQGQQSQQMQPQNKQFGDLGALDPSSMLIPGLSPLGPPEGEKKPEEKGKDGVDPWESFDAQTAFLGPSLWDKRLPYDENDFKLEYMDLEDFLTENGIPVDSSNESGFSGSSKNERIAPSTEVGPSVSSSSICSPQSSFPSSVQFMAGPSRGSGYAGGLPSLSRSASSTRSHSSRSPSPSEGPASMLHDQSNSASESSQSADVALASVPGQEFDPTTRSFTEDELKPQPMIKKSKKQFVPDEQKDAKYWSRRKKNNMAAKRSRDARRVKENQIALRASFLEKESQAIRQEMERLQKENAMLKEQLSRCRREH